MKTTDIIKDSETIIKGVTKEWADERLKMIEKEIEEIKTKRSEYIKKMM